LPATVIEFPSGKVLESDFMPKPKSLIDTVTELVKEKPDEAIKQMVSMNEAVNSFYSMIMKTIEYIDNNPDASPTSISDGLKTFLGINQKNGTEPIDS